jgi:hypothetical protein
VHETQIDLSPLLGSVLRAYCKLVQPFASLNPNAGNKSCCSYGHFDETFVATRYSNSCPITGNIANLINNLIQLRYLNAYTFSKPHCCPNRNPVQNQ